MWRSPVARLVWDQEVAGSNPAAPIRVSAILHLTPSALVRSRLPRSVIMARHNRFKRRLGALSRLPRGMDTRGGTTISMLPLSRGGIALRVGIVRVYGFEAARAEALALSDRTVHVRLRISASSSSPRLRVRVGRGRIYVRDRRRPAVLMLPLLRGRTHHCVGRHRINRFVAVRTDEGNSHRQPPWSVLANPFHRKGYTRKTLVSHCAVLR